MGNMGSQIVVWKLGFGPILTLLIVLKNYPHFKLDKELAIHLDNFPYLKLHPEKKAELVYLSLFKKLPENGG